MIKESKTLLMYDSKNALKGEFNVLSVTGNKMLVENIKTRKQSYIELYNVNQNRSWLLEYKFYVIVKEWKM